MISSIKPTQISVHNPVFGPRNLGHYFGSMKDLVAAQHQCDSIVVIDDLLAVFMTPRDRKAIPNRSYFVVQDFINAGFDTEKNNIVLTSQIIPEIMDLILFFSTVLEQDYLMHLHENSFLGGLKSWQRRGMELELRPSVLEALYPALAMPAVSLGLDVELFHGGEEIMGYTYIMQEITMGLRKQMQFQLHAPVYEPSQNTAVLGIDGRYMFQDNCIFLCESIEDLTAKIDMIQDKNVLIDWFGSLGHPEYGDSLYEKDDFEFERLTMKELLLQELQPFRDNKQTITQIKAILKKGESEVKERLQARILELKSHYSILAFE